ncbi:ribulose-phosphate 3-epimerase [Novacetimonas cocois]|uniref:Ribulose-phosphate 3-epimerase n=1 Tax=Novacetimonas cocois TaxID=1747507 RepID=A0A365YVI2_9PROT|nr:ribulose-phosphate 3-epimerase [Novacetimonas cocois]RBM06138.1 ribulose-phosphate 3-epimerase [Novacetimonas cocois]
MAALSSPLIAPSVLSADFSRMADEVAAVEKAGADWLHLDVMDGHFVPNLSMGTQLVSALRPHSRLPFDVHLMVAPVDSYIAAFAKAGADHIHIHVEAGPHTHRSLQHVRDHGVKAGLAICPATPPEAVEEVLDLVDMILVMTVNPGFGGQKFLTSQLRKIRTLREMADATGRDIRIGVDGGITPETATLATQAGADVLIAGTSVYGQEDYARAINALRTGGASRPA